jgi:NADH dehydrogenase
VADAIRKDLTGKSRGEFRYHDKGQMATIGRSRAITEVGKYRLTGWMAWLAWLVVHIYFLTGFRNRMFVVASWAWSFITFRRGSRLIVGKQWQMHAVKSDPKAVEQSTGAPLQTS